MWDKLKKIAGFFWAAPVTLPGLVYAGLFGALGWYRWHGAEGVALVWKVDDDACPEWLRSAWRSWAGHAIGNVIVMHVDPEDSESTLRHEMRHAEQCMRLGVFQPVMYGLNMLAIKLGCPDSDPYYSNPFEIDARRAAGQLIDVEGEIKKMKSGAP